MISPPADITWTFKLGDVWSSESFREQIYPWMRSFSASDAPKVLRFRARRSVGRKVLEVANEYPKGALTTSEGIAASLVLVGASLDAENDRLPI